MIISDLSYLETVSDVAIQAANTTQDLAPVPVLQSDFSTVSKKAISPILVNSIGISFNIANIAQSKGLGLK